MQKISSAMFAAVLVLLSAQALALKPDPSVDNKIVGKISIDFGTRNNGPYDVYTIDLNATNRVLFEGTVNRSMDGSRPLLYEYNVKVNAVNPKNINQVLHAGDILGGMAIDSKNAYLFAGNSEIRVAQPLHYQPLAKIDADTSYLNGFQGKAVKPGGVFARLKELAGQAAAATGIDTITRKIGTRTIKLDLNDPDPITFRNTQVAAGPMNKYGAVTINGEMTYGYTGKKSGVYVFKNLTMQSGQGSPDVFTGTMVYQDTQETVKMGGKDINCTGSYDVNLQVNEAAVSAQKNDEEFFNQAEVKNQSDEDSFFAVNNSVPSITGKICITDNGTVTIKVDGKDTEAPTSSEINYDLTLNKVTDIQAVNFVKLALIILGPVFDE
jgi:hypothetical protein